MKATFIQPASFAKDWQRLDLTDEDLQALEEKIMDRPEAGVVVRGTGGLRKLRFAPPSWHRGKSGAARVCYVYFLKPANCYLLTVFAKNEEPTSLPPTENIGSNGLHKSERSFPMKAKSLNSPTSRSAAKRKPKTNAAGRKLMAALDEIIAAESDPNAAPLIRRTIDIPEPRAYSAGDVKGARQQLGISQRIFSSLLGVSVELVENWEQGRRVPALWARRLLDEVTRDPGHWKSMLRRSA